MYIPEFKKLSKLPKIQYEHEEPCVQANDYWSALFEVRKALSILPYQQDKGEKRPLTEEKALEFHSLEF